MATRQDVLAGAAPAIVTPALGKNCAASPMRASVWAIAG